MSSVECLREFVNERLTAAAEEIFGVFTTTIVKYEEEIDRQRKLLDVVLKPELKLHRIEPQQQQVCEQKEVLPEQQLCVQEGNPSLDQEVQTESPKIKEELCSQEGGRLVPEQEPDTFTSYPTDGESAHSEVNSESVFNMPVISSVVSEAHSHNQLLSHNSEEAESQDQTGGRHGDLTDAEQKSQKIHHESNSHTDNHYNAHRGKRRKPLDQEPPQNKEETDTSVLIISDEETDRSEDLYSNLDDTLSGEDESISSMPVISSVVSEAPVYNSHEAESQDQKGEKKHYNYINNSKSAVDCNDHTGKKVFQCGTCGKYFNHKAKLQRHQRIHTGTKSYSCNTCGKRFCDTSILNAHIKIHSAEKLHSCKTCGRNFRLTSQLLVHVRRAHPGEKPYSCKTCGTSFKWSNCLTLHMKTHSGEKT